MDRFGLRKVVFPIIGLLYLLIYISHIIYGPYFLHFYFENKPLQFRSENVNELFTYSFYYCYVFCLLAAYFFFFPNTEKFLLTLLFGCMITFAYIGRYFDSPYFSMGLTDHIFLILPLCLCYFLFQNKLFIPTTYSVFVLLLIGVLYSSHSIIY